MLYSDDNNKVTWFRKNIKYYEKVLTRPENLDLPNIQFGTRKDEIIAILSQYTDKELLDFHRPNVIYMLTSRHLDRPLLLGNIADLYLEARWFLLHSDCKNDDNINVLTMDLRSEIDKNDPSDITLSYGVFNYYHCYQMSELEASFGMDGKIFRFLNPDFNPSNPTIDPIENGLIQKEFSTKAVEHLDTFLRYYIRTVRPDERRRIALFLNKIKLGLEYRRLFNPIRQVKQSVDQFHNFSVEQQEQIKLFLTWLFLYSMYMRFWIGPGHPYPIRNINILGESESCLPTTRDEHIFIEQGVGNIILNVLNPSVVDWINMLNVINYVIETRSFVPDEHKLIELLNTVQTGQACMGYASDMIFDTSYYFLNNLFGIDVNTAVSDINSSCKSFELIGMNCGELPVFLDIEQKLIPSFIQDANELPETTAKDIEYKQNRIKILNDRWKALQQPIKPQPEFNIENISYNVHISG